MKVCEHFRSHALHMPFCYKSFKIDKNIKQNFEIMRIC